MYKLAPSILSADFSALGNAISAVEKAGAHYIHFDVMDGRFVPNISFGIPVLSSVRRGTKLALDVHLMVEYPEKHVDSFVRAGADIISVHWESFEKNEEARGLESCIRKIKEFEKKAGLVINPHTPLEPIFPFVEKVDMLLVMSVEPGFGGQSLLPFTLGKAERLANFVKQKELSVDIQMDGGIDMANLRTVLNAGVNVIVAGTSVFGAADISFGVQRFLETFASYEIRQRNKQRARR